MIPEKEIKKEQRIDIQNFLIKKRTQWFKNIEIAKSLWLSKTITSWIYKEWEKYEVSFKKAKTILERIKITEINNVD